MKHISLMKGKWSLLVGLLIGILLGWVLGFLRMPYVEKDDSFQLGFISASVCFLLLLLLWSVWNRNALISNQKSRKEGAYSGLPPYVRRILMGGLGVGVVWIGIALYHQNESFNIRNQSQEKKLQEMEALIASEQNNSLKPLLQSLLEDLEAELKQSPARKLRDTTISRIVALSAAFKPNKYLEGDSISEKAYSADRGQLLQALALMRMDSGSFAQIKRRTSFAGADLRGIDVKGLDLSGTNLSESNLKNADLSGANLSGTNLSEGNLWGANLNRANLKNANLERADLSWAQLNEANLQQANLNGVILAYAHLIKADLNKATFQWAQSEGALFNDAMLTSVSLIGANLSKANLTRADLSASNLRKINLKEADLVEVKFDNVIVDKNWPDGLKEWRPTGLKALQEGYQMVNDTFDIIDKRPLFRLRKI